VLLRLCDKARPISAFQRRDGVGRLSAERAREIEVVEMMVGSGSGGVFGFGRWPGALWGLLILAGVVALVWRARRRARQAEDDANRPSPERNPKGSIHVDERR
jgi:hypothetical protein